MESHRRVQQSSSEDSELQMHIADNLDLLELLDTVDNASIEEFHSLETSDMELHRRLSLRSVISTSSSAAQRNTAAQSQDGEVFTKIGAGACGAIFSQDGKSTVIKLAKVDDTALWNDYQMHSLIAEQFRKFDITTLKIPTCFCYYSNTETNFFENHPKLVEAAQAVCNLPTRVLATERILPLPEATRQLLIEKFCPPRVKESALVDPANKDCLVRIYLGSFRGNNRGMFFSLRNFKLHLNQMVELHLDVEQMAHRMAIGMATMHWAARTDARDVEFALGSSTTRIPLKKCNDIMAMKTDTTTGPTSYNVEDFSHRTTQLWVLDFNQVRQISLDEPGVQQAVNAATINDPYLPKPLQKSMIERQVWNTFVKSYLAQSRMILDRKLLHLPRMFIQGLIKREEERQKLR